MNYSNENKNKMTNDWQLHEVTINFKAVFMEILDKLVIILLCGIIIGTATYFLYTKVILPDYVSTTSMYILPQSSSSTVSYAELEAGAQLTTDYMEIVKGRTVIEETIKHFSLDETYEEFCKKCQVENPVNTRILNISVKDKDPAKAREMAIYMRDKSVKAIEEGMNIQGVTVIEDANLPQKPEHNPFVISAVFGIIAAFIVIIIVIIRYLAIDRIVTADDIEKRLNLTVLGTIAYENRNKYMKSKGMKK